jgi:isopentenyl-diphosphate delta-isomerase
MSVRDLILVNDADEEVGVAEKVACHATPARLHRAFSIYVFDYRHRLMIQRRQVGKLTWPGYWSNTCCSHAVPGEALLYSGSRRLEEELGFTCQLTHLFTFRYQAAYDHSWGENEIDHVFAGVYSGEIVPNRTEVSDVRLVEPRELLLDVSCSPDRYTPWFRLSLPRVLDAGSKCLESAKHAWLTCA